MKYIYKNKEYDCVTDICEENITESCDLMSEYLIDMDEVNGGNGFVNIVGLSISVWSVYLNALSECDRSSLRNQAVEYYAAIINDQVEDESGEVETIIGTIEVIETNE